MKRLFVSLWIAAWALSGVPSVLAADSVQPRTGPTHYFRLSDTHEIAINIRLPGDHCAQPDGGTVVTRKLGQDHVRGVVLTVDQWQVIGASDSESFDAAVQAFMAERCDGSGPWPVVLEMSGYESGSSDGSTLAGDIRDGCRQIEGAGLADPSGNVTCSQMPLTTGTREAHQVYFEDRFVTVVASVRGTGCSSGEFDLFSQTSSHDGKELIEWLAKRAFSNGDVGYFGHSYSGLTGALIAATRPPSLKVVSLSGLFGDVYRDIVYPGGLTNYGFPLLWTGGVRLAYDYGGGTLSALTDESGITASILAQENRLASEVPHCAVNQARRSRTVLNDPLLHGLAENDSDWYRARSLINYVDNIDVPVHITAGHHDEQTGGRGPTHVWDHLNDRIDRRLVLHNGNHDMQVHTQQTNLERMEWLDHYLLGKPFSVMPTADEEEAEADDEAADAGPRNGQGNADGKKKPKKGRAPHVSARMLLQVHNDGNGNLVPSHDVQSAGWPLPETDWTKLYFAPGGALDIFEPEADTASYLHGTHRQGYSYQAGKNEGGELTASDSPADQGDELVFRLPIEEDGALAGPIGAVLYLSSTAPEVELQVQVLDYDPANGTYTYVTRGVLRGGHRGWFPESSQTAKTADGETVVYRPWRAHTGAVIDQPETVVEYVMDVFPATHYFRAGHELRIKVHAPAFDDNDWIYVPKTAPGVNTLHMGGDTPSHIWLPVVPSDAVRAFSPDTVPERCPYEQVRCVTPQHVN